MSCEVAVENTSWNYCPPFKQSSVDHRDSRKCSKKAAPRPRLTVSVRAETPSPCKMKPFSWISLIGMRLCFHVIRSFLPSLPAGCRDADHNMLSNHRTPPAPHCTPHSGQCRCRGCRGVGHDGTAVSAHRCPRFWRYVPSSSPRRYFCHDKVMSLLDVPLVHGPDPVWSALQSQGHPVW